MYTAVSLCGEVANELDYNIVVSEFKLQLHYYIHFWAKESYEAFYPLSYSLNKTTNKDSFDIK